MPQHQGPLPECRNWWHQWWEPKQRCHIQDSTAVSVGTMEWSILLLWLCSSALLPCLSHDLYAWMCIFYSPHWSYTCSYFQDFCVLSHVNFSHLWNSSDVNAFPCVLSIIHMFSVWQLLIPHYKILSLGCTGTAVGLGSDMDSRGLGSTLPCQAVQTFYIYLAIQLSVL